MKSFVARSRWAAIGAAIAVSFGGGAVFVANAGGGPVNDPGNVFVPVEPCRLLDTREEEVFNIGVRSGRIGPTSVEGQFDGVNQLVNNDITVYFDVNADELGDCDGAIEGNDDPVALVVNLTALNASYGTFVTVYPWIELTGDLSEDADVRPFISHVNPWPNHHPMANTITVGLRADTGDQNDDSPAGTGWRALRVYNEAGRVDVILDVVGYYR